MNAQANIPRFQPSQAGSGSARPPRKPGGRPAAVRFGDWLLVPAEQLYVHDWLIHRDERFGEAGGSAMTAEQAFRTGGEVVYASEDFPLGVSEATYRRLLDQDPLLAQRPWRQVRSPGSLFVRGRLAHPDCGELVLDGWHRAIRQPPVRRPEPANA